MVEKIKHTIVVPSKEELQTREGGGSYKILQEVLKETSAKVPDQGNKENAPNQPPQESSIPDSNENS